MRLIANEKSIPRIHLIGTLLIVLLLTVGLAGYNLWQSRHYAQSSFDRIEQALTEQIDVRLNDEMRYAITTIEFIRSQTEAVLRESIMQQVDSAYQIAEAIYTRESALRPAAEVQKMIVETLRPIRFYDGRGYFFIDGMDGQVFLLPTSPQLEGTSLLENQDDTGHFILRGLIAAARRPLGQGFSRYRWYTPENPKVMADKLSYVRHFEPYDWLIGTGDYLYKWEERQKQEAILLLGAHRFGTTGYAALFDASGSSLLSPSNASLEGKTVASLPVFERSVLEKFLSTARSGGGIVQYDWPHADTGMLAKKTAYVRTYAPWQWVVVTALFDEEMHAAVVAEQQANAQLNTRQALTIALAGLVALLLGLTASWIFSRWMRQLFEGYHRNNLAQQNALRQQADALHETQVSLQESEHHFRTLANGGTALIWAAGADKMCNYFNEPWLRYTGRTLEKEFGNGWTEGVHPDDFDRCLNIYVSHFERREPFAMECRLRKANGEYGWILDLGNPRHDSEGNFTGYIGYCYEITDQKQAEKALRESEATVRKKLKSIVDPEGDISTLELSDIIDVEIMKDLMEKFYRATGMLGAVLDVSGKVVVAFGWQDICTKFHRCHPETARNCMESDTVLTLDVPPGTVRAYKCKNNMWDMVTPLMLGGQHLGNVFFGQFLYEGETNDIELFRNQARQYGFDETEYLAALARVPHVKREVAEAGLMFCTQMAGIVATLSHSAIKQARILAEQRRTEIVLRTYAERLKNLHRIDQVILQAIESPEKITQEAILLVRDLLRCQRVSVGMFDFAKKEARVFAATGDADSVVQTGQLLPEELYGELNILQQNRLEIVEDSLIIETVPVILRTIQAEGIRSSINAPITSPKGLIGALNIGWDTPRTITSEEQEIVSEVASQIAIAIEQARLLQETKRHAEELEEKVRLRTTQLEATNKELEAFSYSVSHDLRAPLRHIIGYVDLLNHRFREALPEKAGHYLSEITDSASQMGTLIDDLLQLSKNSRQELRCKEIDMNDAVQEVIEKLKVDTKNRNISWSVAKLPRVIGDYLLLKQVWMNLLENAVKYTRNKDEAEIEIGFTQEPYHWVFFVRDNGVGFDMQYAHKLFGVFQRLHSQNQFEGTGIGLANVQRIVHKHGGQVRAESRTDEGAAFYFTIPINTFDEGSTS